MNPDIVWGAYAALAFGAFGVLEWTGIQARKHGPSHGTLTAALRRWMGFDPLAPRRWVWRVIFGGSVAWFFAHILTGWV